MLPTVAVAALSARVLAQSALRAGLDVLALDLFGDVDTQRAARHWWQIGDPARLRIDEKRFLAALAQARDLGAQAWIAGAGFEPIVGAMERGERILPLTGNGAGVVRRLREPQTFFSLLDANGIAHPDVAFAVPAEPEGWLQKDFGSSGGWHIRSANDRSAAPHRGAYFQLAASGRPVSALFVADGMRARIVAVGEQTIEPIGAHPFVYCGALGPIDVPRVVIDQLQHAIDVLTRAAHLSGLASLDVLLDGERVAVLEINPRPSATMALYDSFYARGLIHAHITASRGHALPEPLPRSVVLNGTRVVFAPADISVSSACTARLLAGGCGDVPQPGTIIGRGDPMCSVRASGATPADVHAALVQRRDAVLREFVKEPSRVDQR